jgi:hypothetical protein
MEGEHTIRIWLTLLLGAAVLLGCGVFFAFQDLGNATEYASVASFFLALITGVASMLSFARTKASKEHGNYPYKETGPQTISDCGVVMTGTGAKAKVTINVGHDAACGCQISCHPMRPGNTRGSGRRAGPCGEPGHSRPERVDADARQAGSAAAPGAADAGYSDRCTRAGPAAGAVRS